MRRMRDGRGVSRKGACADEAKRPVRFSQPDDTVEARGRESFCALHRMDGTYSSAVAMVHFQALLCFADAACPRVVYWVFGRHLPRAGRPLHGGTVATGRTGGGGAVGLCPGT